MNLYLMFCETIPTILKSKGRLVMNETNSKKLLTFFLMFLCSGAIVYPEFSYAAVTLPWSSTFNCAEYDKSQGGLNCNGLEPYATSSTCTDSVGTHYTQITTDANHTNGGGGRGLRVWEGDGWNIGSNGFIVNWGSGGSIYGQGKTEIWVSWYMRYQKGFQWSSLIGDKWMYFNATLPSKVVALFSNNYVNFWVVDQGTANHYGTATWNSIMGSSQSDGQWHAFQVHLKMDTNGSDGIGEMWVDGTKVSSYNNMNYGTNSNGWTMVVIETNKESPANGKCAYIDIDDVAVSSTGPIGLLPDTKIPLPPIPSVQ